MQPTFETERLIVRPRHRGDLEDCLAMDRDPEVTRFIPGPWHGGDPLAHRRFVLDRMAEDYGIGLGYWSIVARAAPETFLGWVILIPDDAVGPEIEIGWRLTRAAWGRGIGTEAARRIVAHAFETLGLPRVIANIHPENAASRRLAEKLGMSHTGDRDDGVVRWSAYVLSREAYLAQAQ